jgi:hypothetical protein
LNHPKLRGLLFRFASLQGALTGETPARGAWHGLPSSAGKNRGLSHGFLLGTALAYITFAID